MRTIRWLVVVALVSVNRLSGAEVVRPDGLQQQRTFCVGRQGDHLEFLAGDHFQTDLRNSFGLALRNAQDG